MNQQGRPISNISASSMRSARLPVNVFGAVDNAAIGSVGRP